ncbi:MAG: hypothetical protein ACT4QC_11925 [Planctomycetaceae bacterium]
MVVVPRALESGQEHPVRYCDVARQRGILLGTFLESRFYENFL